MCSPWLWQTETRQNPGARHLHHGGMDLPIARRENPERATSSATGKTRDERSPSQLISPDNTCRYQTPPDIAFTASPALQSQKAVTAYLKSKQLSRPKAVTARKQSLPFGVARQSFAVSSSPRPWMDVFALPEKSNMAVTERDPDPKVWKSPWLVDDCATSELSMRAWNWNVTDSKKPYFWPDYSPIFPIWQSKEMSHDFVRSQSVAETCSSHWG